MLGDSSSVLATTTTTPGGGGGGGGAGGHKEAPPLTGGHHEGSSNDVGGEEDKGKIEGDRSYGGSRWPRQETLALLKIRSGMDVAFRDASVKGPLWEEVSRKLAELGYNRSAKKCKEKFENVYKYHKRTKDGRTGKQEGKTYRFFDQLEAFESHPSSLSSPLPLPPQQSKAPTPAVTATVMQMVNPSPNIFRASHSTVPSTAAATLATNMSQGIVPSAINLTVPPFPSTNPTILPPSQATNPTNPPHTNISPSFPNFSSDLISNSTSSSTSSDVELQERCKRKRKWKDFFERLMKEVIQKQEEMQKKFLEAIERLEHERMVREESWRMQEMTRINRESEILAQERSVAASKNAEVMAFLQKLSEEQHPGQIQNNPPPSQPPRPPGRPPILQLVPTPPPPPPLQGAQAPLPQAVANVDMIMKSDNGDQNFTSASPSRWPKVEVEALIRIRTNLDCKYQDNGPKGPLWEEISASMRKLGYNRNAKRCKEKWENINKYFKKVKESKKRRPEDSKTCPYFQQLDALYKEKNKIDGPSNMKPENSVPLMVRPEQQWPPPQHEHRPHSEMEDLESGDHQNHDDEDDKNMDDEDEDEVDEASGYEVVANKQTSMNTDG
ncbi:PREDICTED: trihelix transcription factor GT-2-like [Populus euphratica]|uniref:Trihelix transcription factor GT-2-like n=1 Tax=Populus euphratica TaxID=75702 RepID=A0AAJ6V991_POPEU|nr:PREDICTED: trihelix transcription factor GT-2-like [Populus euphratica]